jgi:hypothetical protein
MSIALLPGEGKARNPDDTGNGQRLVATLDSAGDGAEDERHCDVDEGLFPSRYFAPS